MSLFNLLVFAAVFAQLSGLAPALSESDWVTVSRCRAGCVGALPVADGDCTGDDQCRICWGMCEVLIVDPVSWGPTCNAAGDYSVCPEGCETACDFMMTSVERVYAPDFSAWQFPSLVTADIADDDTVVFSWERPMGGAASEALVYTTYWRSQMNPTWQQHVTTAGLGATLNGPHHLYIDLEFKVTAVSAAGVVAQQYPSYPGAPAYDYPVESDYPESDADYPAYYPAEAPAPTTPEPVTPLSVSVELLTAADGVLECHVQWDAPLEPVDFVVRWERQECRGCDSPLQRLATVVNAHGNSATVTIPGVTYNSKYWVEVEGLQGQQQRVYFYTPLCDAPGQPLSTCVPQTPPTAATPSSASPASQPSYQLSFYIALAVSITLLVLVVAMATVLLRTHAQLRQTLVAKMAAIRQRSRSLRRSLRPKRSSGGRRSLRAKNTKGLTLSLADLPLTSSKLSPDSACTLLAFSAPASPSSMASRALPPLPRSAACHASSDIEEHVYVDMD